MRVVAKLDGSRVPATLALSIFGAPHRRMHTCMIRAYREEIRRACVEAGIHLPIDTTVDLWLLFIDPTSPDYDNLLVALYRALDSKTLASKGKTPGIVADDGTTIGVIRNMAKIYTT